MKPAQGFTLVELMVTVAIIAILAAIALPGYRDYVIRGKLTEAHTVLASQRVKMEQFYQDMRTYNGACTNGTVAPDPNGAAKYFSYACALNDQAYTITATGNAGEGLSGFTFTLDQSNNKTSAGPTGWGSSANCWIRAKGSQC